MTLHSWFPILLGFLLGGSAPAEPVAEPFSARCVGVTDGDTLSVLTAESVLVKVRLEGIDAPEHRQAFGEAAKQALSALVFGKRITIRPTGTDRYGRTLADVTIKAGWVNLLLVESGHAWRFDRYSQSPALGTAQERAQKARRGLWGAIGPVPRRGSGARPKQRLALVSPRRQDDRPGGGI